MRRGVTVLGVLGVVAGIALVHGSFASNPTNGDALPLVDGSGDEATPIALPEKLPLADTSRDVDAPPAWADGSIFGLVFPSAPKLPPAQPPDDDTPTLEDVRRHLAASDTHRALKTAARLASERKWGRDRDAAWLVQGLLHREAGRHNLASEAFTKVRVAKGPLAEIATYYEAEQDLVRGKPWVAVRECQNYRESYPEGLHATDCLRVIAQGRARVGNFVGAREAADAYDEEHPRAEISEQIELDIARWLKKTKPESAIGNLQELALDHEASLTGRVAEDLLAELLEDGFENASIPDETWALKKRAVSLRDSGRRHRAWEIYEELMTRSADDPALGRWVENEAESFGWRTRNWDFLARFYAARYADKPTGKDAWNHYRSLSRGGHHSEAADVALAAQEAHGSTREWRRTQETVAQTLLLAKRYEEAVPQYDIVKKRWGWSGRRAQFYGGFAALQAGKHQDAADRLSAIVDANRTYVTEARYWRAQAFDALEEPELAAADRRWILENEPFDWYAVLLRGGGEVPDSPYSVRDGSWPGTPPPPVPEVVEHEKHADPGISAWVRPREVAATRAFSALSWPLGALQEPAQSEVIEAPVSLIPIGLDGDSPRTSLVAHDPLHPPESYRESAVFERDDARQAFQKLVSEHGETWTVLPAIYDLARAGLYDLSGPLMSEMFEDWRDNYRYRARPRHAEARTIRYDQEEWRELFLFARDHHHATRYVIGLQDDHDDPELVEEIMRLQFPLAHDRHVWTHSHSAGLDPYLVLSLMRQESTYNAIVESRAGARGAMQIMPKTGHLLANVTNNQDYTANDLEDPVLAVQYGITYLGLLMERFEDAYPLALASYNGGPHNVSSWLQGTTDEMPMDAFVEHIPYRETRGYVKKVTRNYAHYLAWYGPDDASISLPPTPRGDHPDIVDF